MEFQRIDDIQASTVKVSSDAGEGSGVLLGKSGHVATCAHVVGENKKGEILWFGAPDLNTAYQVEAIDEEWDVAVLRTDPNLFEQLNGTVKVNPLTFVTTRGEIKAGMVIGICGYPWVTGLREKPDISRHPPSITLGIVSLWRGELSETIMLGANLHQGNSGGPVFNEFGLVLGLASQSTVYKKEEIGSVLSMGLPLGYGEMVPMQLVNILIVRERLKVEWTPTSRIGSHFSKS
ncbi:MAG: trypsin-like peptidase domain-containing protein [Nitrososphaerota archaeon]|nr:trypsin-like peptidase domain-containing protein [Nitrososphaerota archaeon]